MIGSRERILIAVAVALVTLAALAANAVWGLATLVLLHAPDGHDIRLNPAAITSMHAAVPGEPNKALTDAVECLINTSDGKFISVVETCDQVRELIRKAEQAQ